MQKSRGENRLEEYAWYQYRDSGKTDGVEIPPLEKGVTIDAGLNIYNA